MGCLFGNVDHKQKGAGCVLNKILLFSHSGFSDTDANGITMKNLLSAWPAAEKAEFYCDVQPPDFEAASNYFRVTDMQMLKAFLGKKSRHVFTEEATTKTVTKETPQREHIQRIPAWAKAYKYNFWVKWTREWLKQISPWGHRNLRKWIAEVNPDVIMYMVGESLFMDRLVLRTCARTGKPLVLYNGEAFRIIDLKTRRGIERAYYRRCQKLYEELNQKASLVIYNSETLKTDYEKRYVPSAKAMVVYNSALCNYPVYQSQDGTPKVVYFGNLGVGRSDSLLKVADALQDISQNVVLDIYGNASPEASRAFEAHPGICYRGFVDAVTLRNIISDADILIHAESFDKAIIPKLRYAFSTKIAQCLGAGRCFVSFAPAQIASSQYLAKADGAILVSNEVELKETLRQLIEDPVLRQAYALKVAQTGRNHHNMQTNAQRVKKEVGTIL